MAEIYNFNYMLNREDLNYCKEELDKILADLNKAMQFINELDPVLNKAQFLFNILQKNNDTENFRKKFQSLGDLIENTQLGFGKFCKYFKNFYDFIAEEKTDIENQISSKSMTEEDVTNLDELFDFRLDEMDLEGECIYDDLTYFNGIITPIGKVVHALHDEYKRDGEITKTENPFQRGELRIVK